MGELADRRLQHLAAPGGLALQLDAHAVDRFALAMQRSFVGGERVAHEGIGGGGELGVFGCFFRLRRHDLARDIFDRRQRQARARLGFGGRPATAALLTGRCFEQRA